MVIDLAIKISKLSNEDKEKVQKNLTICLSNGRDAKNIPLTDNQKVDYKLLIRWLEFNIAFGNDWYPPEKIYLT